MADNPEIVRPVYPILQAAGSARLVARHIIATRGPADFHISVSHEYEKYLRDNDVAEPTKSPVLMWAWPFIA